MSSGARDGCSPGFTGTRSSVLRQEIEPVTAQDFVRFLLRWQRVAPGTQREGRAGVAATIAQLQGFEIPAGRLGGDGAAEPRVRLPQLPGSTSCACRVRLPGRA